MPSRFGADVFLTTAGSGLAADNELQLVDNLILSFGTCSISSALDVVVVSTTGFFRDRSDSFPCRSAFRSFSDSVLDDLSEFRLMYLGECFG